MELEKKLWTKIEERDNLFEKKKKEYDSFPDAFNYPEVRIWYSGYISPIDEEIVELANQVLAYYNKELIQDISDVYDNEFLMSLYNKEKDLNNSKKR